MTRVIAHRGARGGAPENTLAAIDLAARQQADAVEVDVHLTKDDGLVVVHDDTLARTTDAAARFPGRAPWWVSDFATDEIAGLDAGRWFVDEVAKPAGERMPFLRSLTDDERRAIDDRVAARVPSLVEVLDRAATHGLDVHVELKAVPRMRPRLVELAIGTIAAHPHRAAVTVSSFDHRLLVRARALDDRVRTAALVRDRLADPVAYLSSIGATALHPGCGGDDDVVGLDSVDGRVDVSGIRALTDAGFDVNVWTENDPARLARLVDAGVTGIFTDYPARLVALLAARSRP